MESKEQTKFAAKSWMRRDFAQYKADFKRLVELSWNNQIILLPPEDPKDGLSDADYMDLVANPRMPAHVECSLTIRFVDNLGSANAAIQVVHLKRKDDPDGQPKAHAAAGRGRVSLLRLADHQ